MSKKKELQIKLFKFMLQVRKMIISFGVSCSQLSKPISVSNGCIEHYFFIDRNKRNILKFKERIGFRLNQDKIKHLEECYLTIKESIK